MPRRIRIEHVPKTPRGRHLNSAAVTADLVEVDDQITIKSSMLRECVPGNPWFEGEGEEDSEKPKSTDIRKIRRIKDRVEAIRSSPMVDARPRHSKSFTESVTGRGNSLAQPLCLPKPSDLASKTSRRLSRIVLRRSTSLATPRPYLRSLQTLLPVSPPQLAELKESTQYPATPIPRFQSSSTGQENLNQTTPQESVSDPTAPELTTGSQNTTPSGHSDLNSTAAFRTLANIESARLRLLCGDWNGVLTEEQEQMPETASGSVRATVGKCQLLLQKKLPFFQSLVDIAESSSTAQNQDDPNNGARPSADVNDLAGYWALVADEISRIESAFERLRIWRDERHWDIEQRPITPARPTMPAPSHKHASKSVKRVATPRTGKSSNRKPPGRPVESPEISQDTAKALKQGLKNSSQKPRIPVKSKIAEFVRAKRAALASSPLLTLAAASRVQRNILDTLTPLGLRPVNRPSTSTPVARGD
ncbi:unnamed protein product [Calicophoron daubneyi]|uniref:Guanylate kinase-associated protein mars n=1 Tax=Calicophoron daubneyi TaxID=300641 RepID=A0AAV2T8P8_CALDB